MTNRDDIIRMAVEAGMVFHMGQPHPAVLKQLERFHALATGKFPTAPTMHLNSDKTVAVADDYFFNEDMTECPRGVKVQLLGSSGIAIYSQYNGHDPFWVGWAPVPKRRPKCSS